MRKLTFLSICIALVFCLSFASSAVAASDEEEVLQVPQKFITAMNTSNFDMMSSLWWHSDKTTSFNPSSDPFLYDGWEIIGNGWKYISEMPPGSENVTIHHVQATMLGNNAAITTAYGYDVYTDPETKEETISLVRQTLVLQKIGGKWLIVHHHASMFPIE